jgi:F-type H+-transporting ATPase subunit delta
MLSTVAKRYASALYDIAIALGRVDEIDNQAQALEHIFDDKLSRDFFTSPRISAEQKKKTLVRLLSGRVEQPLLDLCQLLVDKKRIELLPDIMRYYDIFTDRFRGVEDITIVSAVPLTNEQTDAIVKSVARFGQFGGEFRRKLEVDSGVIGGVKVILGGQRVFDGTLSSRLREMRQSMYRFRHRGVGA